MRNEAGMLFRSAEEEMHQWREHFQTVLNHEDPLNPPEEEPNDELNIRTGRITRIEIKNAIKKLKTGRLQDVIMFHQRQLRREGTCQRRFFWTSARGYEVRRGYQRSGKRVC